ncbi:MAG: hypothetical protein U0V02_17415 [Anaerolineales bacterium]
MKTIHSLNNKRMLQRIFILALGISFCIPLTTAVADMGPHPTMDSEFQYNIAPVSMESAKLMFCQDLDCKTSQEVMGPFRCDLNSCSYSYGGNTYYKLVVNYSDKTRESNTFQKTRFHSSFRVIVNQDELQVTEGWSSLPYDPGSHFLIFLVALAITIPIELLVASMIFKTIKQSFYPAIIVKANLISLPILWFVFPFIPLNGFTVIFLGEIFAFLFEAWYIQKNQDYISYKTSFWLSLIMNFASFIIPTILIIIGYIPVY